MYICSIYFNDKQINILKYLPMKKNRSAWDQTKNHNNTDDENDKTETKKLKLQE